MIVLGSKALLTLMQQTNTQRFAQRDIDVVMSQEELQAFFVRHKSHIRSFLPKTAYKFTAVLEKDGHTHHYEIETDKQASSAWLLAHRDLLASTSYEDPFGNVFAVPCAEVLFLTKKSHITFNIHFDKNIQDHQLLQQMVDKKELSVFQPYYRLRRQEAQARHTARHPKLNVPNDTFFDRSKNIVGYVFVHDDIHEAVKHFDTPVYEMMKTDMSQAWCDKDMFAALPLATRIKCVQEEAYVIAIERFIALQKGNHTDHFLAYTDALRRICTTLCSGFFRDFAIHHHASIVQAYDPSFFQRFQAALAADTVRRIDSCPQEVYDKTRRRLLAIHHKATRVVAP